MHRRQFIRSGSLSVAALAIATPHELALRAEGFVTGVQLYTVRDLMGKDPAGTLKALAGFGYRYVEHANYVDRKFYGYTPAEYRKVLDGNGLVQISGHSVLRESHWDKAAGDFTDEWKHTIEDAVVAGQQYIVSPWLDDSLRKADALKAFMDIFNKCGELCKKSGVTFGYHNHDFEFSTMVDGKRLYDLILAYTDPNLVVQQIDIGNMLNGGAKAADVIGKYPNRFSLMHVKDEIKAHPGGEEKYESCELGKGIVPVKQILDMGKAGGVKVFIIEQETYQGQSPLVATKKDLAVMKGWGY